MNTTQNAVEKYTGGHFDSGIQKPHENILGIKNSTSHTQLGCYSISSPFSPNATFNRHLQRPYMDRNILQELPFLTPPASPSLWFFKMLHSLFEGGDLKQERKRRGKGKANKSYSVPTVRSMILLILNVESFGSIYHLQYSSQEVITEPLSKI